LVRTNCSSTFRAKLVLHSHAAQKSCPGTTVLTASGIFGGLMLSLYVSTKLIPMIPCVTSGSSMKSRSPTVTSERDFLIASKECRYFASWIGCPPTIRGFAHGKSDQSNPVLVVLKTASHLKHWSISATGLVLRRGSICPTAQATSLSRISRRLYERVLIRAYQSLSNIRMKCGTQYFNNRRMHRNRVLLRTC